MCSRGQALIETVLGLVIVTFIFIIALTLSQMLRSRIILDHAAMRAARAKTAGLNDYMCLKSARAAMIPIAGKRLWPENEAFLDEASRIGHYLSSQDEAHARGILEYEKWTSTDVKVSSSLDTITSRLLYQGDGWQMDGKAQIEAHYPLYMNSGQ